MYPYDLQFVDNYYLVTFQGRAPQVYRWDRGGYWQDYWVSPHTVHRPAPLKYEHALLHKKYVNEVAPHLDVWILQERILMKLLPSKQKMRVVELSIFDHCESGMSLEELMANCSWAKPQIKMVYHDFPSASIYYNTQLWTLDEKDRTVKMVGYFADSSD